MSADQIAGIRKHAQQLADPSLCEAWGRLCSRGRIKVVVADDATFVSGEVGLRARSTLATKVWIFESPTDFRVTYGNWVVSISLSHLEL